MHLICLALTLFMYQLWMSTQTFGSGSRSGNSVITLCSGRETSFRSAGRGAAGDRASKDRYVI